MRKNIGTADRIIRFLITALIMSLLVTHTIAGSRMVFFGWATAAILLITTLDQTSPLYLLLGINTRGKNH